MPSPTKVSTASRNSSGLLSSCASISLAARFTFSLAGQGPLEHLANYTVAAMSYRELKSDASGALALLVGGAVLLLLTWLGMDGDHFRIWRGGPELSRATHPLLFWSCQITFILAGVLSLVLGV